MSKKQVKLEGILKIADYLIPCYVLNDGTRVLSGRAMQTALNMANEDSEQRDTGQRLIRCIEQKSIREYLFKDKPDDYYTPIKCTKGKKVIHAYEASLLADICEGYLDARSEIELSSRQKLIADRCEILLRGFARVGLMALIDEATGYQYEREKSELQKILSAYVSEEILDWQLTFTMEFYQQVYRLWSLEFNAETIQSKPQFIGKITSKYIYELMPKCVVEKIKDNSEKGEDGRYKYKWHQSLTNNIGREQLKKHVAEVTTLMAVAYSKEHFISLFNRRYKTDQNQTALKLI